MTLKEKVMSHEMYLSGKPFHAQKLAARLGSTQRAVSATLLHMRASGDAVRDSGLWRRPVRHWVNGRRLANVDWLNETHG